jgi:Phosphotransferase system mannitol/fructose-specific IIA domain (Ntr-type)
MDIGDLLTQDGVVLRGGMSSKRQALYALAEAAAPALGVPMQAVLEALSEREALGSTGLGAGVAVPHARIANLDRVSAVFLRLDQPVAWGAMDDRPVDLIFGLFAAPEAGAEHLRALAAVSRSLRASSLADDLRNAADVDGLRSILVDVGQAASAA